MRKSGKKFFSIILAGSLLAGGIAAGNAGVSEAAQAVSLQSKTLTLDLSKKTTKKIKVKKAKGVIVKKVTFSPKNKGIIVVKKKGTLTANVTAKVEGSTKIKVTVKYQKNGKTAKKTFTCKVTVKSGSTSTEKTPEPMIETTPSQQPQSTEQPTPSQQPQSTEQPTPQVVVNGNITSVKAVLPDRTQKTSGEEQMYGNSDDGWKKEVKKWAEQEKQVDMKKFYTDTLRCFLSEEKSTVYSPINVYMALAMLAEVGDQASETQSQILNLLQVQDTDTLREHIHALWNANYYSAKSAESLLGNSLWLSNRESYNEDLMKTLAEYYHASSFSGTMGSENYNQELRNWVNEYTKDLLKDSVQDMKLETDTVMDLISTIYFKAGWLEKFSQKFTKKEIFHGKSGDKEVDMMHRSGDNSVYMGDKFTGLSLNLSAGKMHFILPKEGTALSDVIADEEVMDMIGVGTVDSAKRREKMDYGVVRMSIPKFRLQSKIDLAAGLNLLGVTKAFDRENAQFRKLLTNLQPYENVYVSKTSHAAMVEVDEDGVTGAAYTEITMSKATAVRDPKTIDFVLDRPFYYIVTGEDGSILFAGTVYDI